MSDPSTSGTPDIPMRIHGAIVTGILAVLLFFGGIVGWAATAPLGSAAIAPGVINVDTDRKTVQHLEGGIITQIMVREGDQVTAGQEIILLDDTAAREQLRGLSAQMSATQQQITLLNEEIETVAALLEKGLVQRPRFLALQRRQAELIGDLEDYQAQTRAGQDVIRRRVIVAPVDGTVVELQVHSVGGVIQPGEPLLYIVPGDEKLIVEARVNPVDIDIVHAGLTAEVRLTPYSFRNTPPVPGEVLSISADSLTDERSGIQYYLARIELDQAVLASLENVMLTSGMPVEVMINTGERTVFEYFLAPITRSLRRAFREN